MANIRALTTELNEIAKSELNENPNTIATELEILKEWLNKQSHLIARQDDQFLIAFLRGCKHNVHKTKDKLEMYYTFRTKVPEFFSNRDPNDPDFLRVFKLNLTTTLPKPHSDGSRIFLFRQGAYDPHEVNVRNIMKISYMMTDRLLWDDEHTVIYGQTIITDLKGLSLGHLAQVSPQLIRKMAMALQEAYPVRLKAIHFVNPPSIFDSVYKLFCGFLTEKIRNRVFVHDSYENLHKYIPKSSLPTDYNGTAGSIESINYDWLIKLKKYREFFLEDENYKSDESLRVGPMKNSAIFGAEGTFRKLEID